MTKKTDVLSTFVAHLLQTHDDEFW